MTGTVQSLEPQPRTNEPSARARRRGFWRKLLVAFLFIVIVGFSGFCGYYHLNPLQAFKVLRLGGELAIETGKGKLGIQRPPFGGRTQVNILLLGADVSFDGCSARTDTIKVLTIDTQTPRISMLSIPRDTWVELPGTREREGRINSAYQYGSKTENTMQDIAARVGMTREAVRGVFRSLTGDDVPIDYYLRIQTEGFVKIIDALGGVNIEVEKKMDYEDPSQGLHIHLRPGYQHLDGYNAMCYVRFRHDAEGDYARIERQNKLMKALTVRMQEPDAKARIPQLAAEVIDMMRTNLTVSDMLALKDLVGQVGKDNIQTFTLPTEPTLKGKAQVVEIYDRAYAAATVRESLYGTRNTVTPLPHPAPKPAVRRGHENQQPLIDDGPIPGEYQDNVTPDAGATEPSVENDAPAGEDRRGRPGEVRRAPAMEQGVEPSLAPPAPPAPTRDRSRTGDRPRSGNDPARRNAPVGGDGVVRHTEAGV